MLQRIKFLLGHLDDYLAMVTLTLIVLITVAGVFMRYVVGSPFSWTEEMLKALVVWFTFLGASVVMRRDDHISIDILVRRLPKRVRDAFLLLRMMVMTTVLVFLFVWGIKLLFLAWFKITPVLHIRYTWIDVIVPCCALAMIVHLFRAFYRANRPGVAPADGDPADSQGGDHE